MANLGGDNAGKKKLDGMRLNALADIPDFRDRYYEPALLQLKQHISPPGDLAILNQGSEGACTGFGLTAVINKLNQDRGSSVRVSMRMLYEMAKKFDRWPGEEYSGSSCRGAIKGWYSMGVCADDLWPYKANSQDTHLTVARAKDARSNTIGAYYRLRKNIVDMHAALNEVGAIYVSADVHTGWSKSAVVDGVIEQQEEILGGHAFAIVGYDEESFWVQNSWGRDWGHEGLAHWSYEDWQANVKDAWVLRLALPTPQLWSAERAGASGEAAKAGFLSAGPRREEIAGHFAHVDDGEFHDEGKYWSTLKDVQETAKYIAGSKKYKHLLFYAHGGLNSTKDSATRIAAMKDTFKANGIYPYHFMYDTGLLEEIKDVILGKKPKAEETVRGLTDWSDRFIERVARRPGRALWREMKSDAKASFRTSTKPGCRTMKAFLAALKDADAVSKQIHLVGHSTGAILLAHLLQALVKMKVKKRVGSVSLLAPAATVDLYESHYLPLLKAAAGKFGIDKMTVYNLDEEHELDDHVMHVYRKSLLYLVSNAFEEELGVPILGMQKFSKKIPQQPRLTFVYSPEDAAKTNSTSHGGFDNDPATMNNVLKTVLGKSPQHPFTEDNLDY